jgi:hypothetical protein
MAQHRHERRHTRATADEKHRPAILGAPVEVSTDRAAELDVVIYSRDIVHEGRDLAVIEPFDRELELDRPVWRRR